jgi:hypothetical protein
MHSHCWKHIRTLRIWRRKHNFFYNNRKTIKQKATLWNWQCQLARDRSWRSYSSHWRRALTTVNVQVERLMKTFIHCIQATQRTTHITHCKQGKHVRDYMRVYTLYIYIFIYRAYMYTCNPIRTVRSDYVINVRLCKWSPWKPAVWNDHWGNSPWSPVSDNFVPWCFVRSPNSQRKDIGGCDVLWYLNGFIDRIACGYV